MSQPLDKAVQHAKEAAAKPGVSVLLPDSAMAETIYDPDAHQTSFAVYAEGQWRLERDLLVRNRRYRPYSPDNNLIAHEVVLFPSNVEEYGGEQDLVEEIQRYLHRYVDVSPLFERLASYYVLFSWVYDAFNELPYLRARGDYGSGKTRFLVTAGAICYLPIFASGASTVSPLFRILDSFRGTLVVDESDLRWSDERAEFVKILNNGNARGFPVLRSEAANSGEYNPRAYAVYGPKLVAGRGVFEDKALESRFLTEEMGVQRVRADIPINLPAEQQAEARRLRNKLLLFRFRNRQRLTLAPDLADPALEPRINQIFTPLLSIIRDPAARADIQELAKAYNRELRTERGMGLESQVLGVIRELAEQGSTPLSVKGIAEAFAERHGDEFEHKVTAKWLGAVLRHRLHLKTQKSHGVYIIPPSEHGKLAGLYEKYDVADPGESSRGR